MKKVLFCDLDGTIIFSKRSLPDTLKNNQCVAVENYGNAHYSFMDKKLLAHLSNWSKMNFFVPVTTRSIEQYDRLGALFSERIRPEYALVSNGGNLYRDGKIDRDWNSKVKQELVVELNAKPNILEILKSNVFGGTIRKIKEIDSLYFCVFLTKTMEEKWKQVIEKQLALYGWQGYFQEKRVYILPEKLSKERAVEKLKALFLPKISSIGIGDTPMDLKMLNMQEQSLYFGKESSIENQQDQTSYSTQKIIHLLYT